MKRSRLLRRLMTLSIFSEVLYMLFVTVLFIFRPKFYTKALISGFDLNISELPVNNPDMTLTIVLYGGIILFFILWFLLKIMMDKDIDPMFLGVIIFLLLPVSTVVYRFMYTKVLAEVSIKAGTQIAAFTNAHFQIMRYAGWANLGAYIFMLMGYAVCRQRFADLD
ncbi:hypothetical protein [uncultured Ruminococcus sp.]|uniref:hypothetical protein n=1 Tax=uncultured Ruminococcus sp. TaxID=165186 RepID=UPI0025FBB05A|nr:hypothetical protein [uncultured Ruminococcus sp.]